MSAAPKGLPLVIAHRGASRDHPDRPLEALEAAVEVGADGVEFDVRQTADGVLVVAHDDAWDGLKLREVSFDELNGRVARGRIPTLDEALDVVAGRLLIDAELKEQGIENAVVARLLDRVDTDALLVTSFDAGSIEAVKAAAPAVRTGLIVEQDGGDRTDSAVGRATACGADAVVPSRDCADEVVDDAVAAGLAVYVWTVNDPAELAGYFRTGLVDGVITDVPSIAVATRAEA